ncbi:MULTISPECIES: DUF3800 domain-containing protein [Paenibacillus]|uniref:DUF3800 domain-containing protein n=1 Tax=Paenibacillus TaxID=44249 RepID=UPI0013E97B2E|nr:MULTISPECIES: DUF3800 domain-containing protein [Paenibacillus]KAF6582740.1 DUF3800 domain-containing protein [Paenibacillus sp. EKM211P]MDU8674251.1 DUF3800 domain-containing protein [Paenibacillus polymyxa]MDU8699159.1 DUF3800 domain-containing protein [Paenibacillus polymyxa]QOH60353.1 hypothetical protein DI243_02545 [Paenibacillus polymyxa]URJ53831.3 DUF3800 domain-containing protein [Paenibacillus polymyxa]
MKRFTLYLDEILTGGHFEHFCLMGLAIAEEDYEKKVIPYVNELKKKFFGDDKVIIHEMDINRHKTATPFKVFQDKQKLQEFWNDITNMFNSYDIPIFGVSIHEDNCKKLYENGRDKYFIALQLIMENFVHFLELNDAKGSIYLESTNSDPDQKDQQLQHHFHYLMAQGTLFYSNKTVQKRLSTINFSLKPDNVIGLQIADLLPNTWNRKLSGKSQRTYGLLDVIEKQAYDGGCNKKDRFGLKIIP